jgi:hypothetical protein
MSVTAGAIGRILVGIAVVAAAAPAVAGLIGTHLAAAPGEPPCYSRRYESEHLRRHPRQRLLSLMLMPATVAGEGDIELRFAFRLKGDPDAYAGLIVCREQGRGLDCLVEGDGGALRIDRAGNSLKLTVARWSVEGARGFSPDLGQGGDDRVILVHRAAAAVCGGLGDRA